MAAGTRLERIEAHERNPKWKNVPLRIEMAARAIPQYLDFASFVISELKAVGVEATLKQIETAQWHPLATRKEYQAGPNLTGIGVDDPDANFFENFACASPRNYTGYCNEQLEKVMAQQSQELDPKKRMQLVAQIQRTLEDEAARPHQTFPPNLRIRLCA